MAWLAPFMRPSAANPPARATTRSTEVRDENETPKEETEGQQESQSTETQNTEQTPQDNDSQDGGVGN